jgi:phosphoenolpyruvate carboxykinase (GTP)
MLPFCGYNMGDYFAHWLSMAQRTDRGKLPKIFFVNWFRTNAEGKYLWPGFGENSRVLKWIVERIEGTGRAHRTAIGCLPPPDAIDLTGIDVPAADMVEILSVDVEGWKRGLDEIAAVHDKFGDHLPQELRDQMASLRQRLAKK